MTLFKDIIEDPGLRMCRRLYGICLRPNGSYSDRKPSNISRKGHELGTKSRNYAT